MQKKNAKYLLFWNSKPKFYSRNVFKKKEKKELQFNSILKLNNIENTKKNTRSNLKKSKKKKY
jgi:hypothetical protein